MNNVLVTGASGFVGKHLLEVLARRNIKTTALYHSRAPNIDSRSPNGSIHWTACDLTRDDIGRHLTGTEVVFHLAGYAGLGSDSQTLEQLNNINVLATKRIASAALEAGCQLVYVSSIHACDYAPEIRIIDESNGHPRSEYGWSKRRAEDAIRRLGTKGLNFITLRPTQLFGEYHEGSVCELAKVIKRRRFVLIGDGHNATNFLYVKDFVDILLRVAQSPGCNRETYIAADEPLPLISLAEHIGAQVGVTLPRFRLPRSLGLMIGSALDLLSSAFNVKLSLSRSRVAAITSDVRYSRRKLSDSIGAELPYGIKMGLTRAIDWYRSAGLL